MSTIVKLADISLTKLNNAEFTYFAGQVISYIDAATVEALHVDAATFAGFKGNHGKLVDIVDQSRAAEPPKSARRTSRRTTCCRSCLPR